MRTVILVLVLFTFSPNGFAASTVSAGITAGLVTSNANTKINDMHLGTVSANAPSVAVNLTGAQTVILTATNFSAAIGNSAHPYQVAKPLVKAAGLAEQNDVSVSNNVVFKIMEPLMIHVEKSHNPVIKMVESKKGITSKKEKR